MYLWVCGSFESTKHKSDPQITNLQIITFAEGVRGLSQTISLISLVYGSSSSLFMKLREKCNQFSSCDVRIYCVLLSRPPSALIPRFVSLQRTIYKYIIKALTTTKRWSWWSAA
jgi:hypothetical protein